MTSKTITTLQTFDTIYPSDSVEWCPLEPYENYFLCGTYQLEEREESTESQTNISKRKGKIYLMKFCTENVQFKTVDVIELSAILDLKWLKNDILFGAANSIGELHIFGLDENEKFIEKTKTKLDENDEKLLTLSLDWSNDDKKIVTSDSKGNLTVFQYNNLGLVKERTWNAHGFEAWTCAFDKSNSNVIYSGGDDTFLNVYDIRISENESTLIYKNKSHSAGVTSLLSLSHCDTKLLTGSYDEILREFDTRKLKQPIADINLRGGIWRIKSNPYNNNLILCACMYHNFSIINYNNHKTNNFNLIADYFEHDSICYGADWSYSKNQQNNLYYFATCSMYDHKLNLSSFKHILN